MVGAQFLSVSMNALGDTPAALAAWLKQFSAAPGWLAAVPRVQDVNTLVERLGSGGEKKPQGPDPHTGQVYVIDPPRRARLPHRVDAAAGADPRRAAPGRRPRLNRSGAVDRRQGRLRAASCSRL